MSSLPPRDPLVALWQTAPKPDPQQLLLDLERLNRLHQRLNRTVFAILCGISILLIFEEATGRVATHGALSAIWILGVVLSIVWRRRARCNRSDALTRDTVSLLKSMISRASSDLFVARCLYAGVPCGAAAGFFVMKLAGIGASPSAVAIPGPLRLLQTGAGVAALIAMMVTGIVLARSRRLQVRELSEKLRLIEADL
jgi:hypothetical protein